MPESSTPEVAVRELFEETSIRVDVGELGEPIAVHRHRFGWNGLTLIQNETYCAVRATAATEISFAGMEQLEVETTDRADWWTPDAPDHDGTAGFPQLADFMRLAVQAVASRLRSAGRRAPPFTSFRGRRS